MSHIQEIPDSDNLFTDREFIDVNQDEFASSKRITALYPQGVGKSLLPDEFSADQFAQGAHYECLIQSALIKLIEFPEIIRNCFVTKKHRRDGRYTFLFYKRNHTVTIVIDDIIPVDRDDEYFIHSPTGHWWPILLEKAYAKFCGSYASMDQASMAEVYFDFTGHPSLILPMDERLAKAAGAEIMEGTYWLNTAQKIETGDFIASALTKIGELESMGVQSNQQYTILEIFSRTGSSAIEDLFVRLYNPYEEKEYEYVGPLNARDASWTDAERKKFTIDNASKTFCVPLLTFIKVVNSIQLCYMKTLDMTTSWSFDSAWKGASAGGSPIYSTWRNNPVYLVRNTGNHAVDIVITISQVDRVETQNEDGETELRYLQCGITVSRYVYPKPIPTRFITGNNHKSIRRSLFLNSREVVDSATIPANSLCYIVPCCMQRGAEGAFTLHVNTFNNSNADALQIEKLDIPGYNWNSPLTFSIEMQEKLRDRLDFFVEDETVAHVLVRQEKPYTGPYGGDCLALDFIGVHIYDDSDRKIGGVHAATNNREISIIHKLPRAGRYALSITCPQAEGRVPCTVSVVTKTDTKKVDAPADATMFDDYDEIDDGNDVVNAAIIDFKPVERETDDMKEVPDSDNVFRDIKFLNSNHVPCDAWMRIIDLYPESKKDPLLPSKMSTEQFAMGVRGDCTVCLPVFASLVEHHPNLISDCFITKNVRRDGRYTFKFLRYGKWTKVEIDDRIPVIKGEPCFCQSHTKHWWPLLLEKAYAKFNTLYFNLEGASTNEAFHDFTGRPVVNVDFTDAQLLETEPNARSPSYWLQMKERLLIAPCTALTAGGWQPGSGFDLEYLLLRTRCRRSKERRWDAPSR
ncbi:Calpain family cysteine protease/Calpain large subunit, domain III, putative [Angomonas deanei]|uniref:Calpain family cysteine protease/Calpain large subunit, domain III, putative n=1 Tax=Angomonas deanei TaxID=59799 RepID=A0A7G2C1S7_9TRYP|nr:Calpain family cysteine protease/Calpain large subunit, domain III, putative [Angomonas deanei]